MKDIKILFSEQSARHQEDRPSGTIVVWKGKFTRHVHLPLGTQESSSALRRVYIHNMSASSQDTDSDGLEFLSWPCGALSDVED